MTTKRSPMKCPHCGKVYANLRSSLIPDHPCVVERDWPGNYVMIQCPGSGQYPRNAESDKRPLWKDEKKEAKP